MATCDCIDSALRKLHQNLFTWPLAPTPSHVISSVISSPVFLEIDLYTSGLAVYDEVLRGIDPENFLEVGVRAESAVQSFESFDLSWRAARTDACICAATCAA